MTTQSLAELERIVKDADALLAKNALEVENAKRSEEEYRANNKLEFFNTPKEEGGIPANPLQEELIQAWEDPYYKVFTYSGANRIGKTTIGCGIIGISTMIGYWPWDRHRL